MDGMKQQPNTTSEGMLANFFNSLLNKKTGVPSTQRPGISLYKNCICSGRGSGLLSSLLGSNPIGMW